MVIFVFDGYFKYYKKATLSFNAFSLLLLLIDLFYAFLSSSYATSLLHSH